MAVLSVNITQAFGSFRLETQFEVEEGSITAIFGKSGAGKTSTINAIAGLTRPDVGVIQIGNTTLFDQNLRINLPIYKRQIGYVFQDDRLFPHMTVRNNLIYGTPKNRDVANSLNLTDITGLLELAPLLERRPRTLSGGEKQRVAIGRALLSNPKLLLMDEPLASIDVQHRFEILPFIQRVREKTGITIIYVTHALEEVIFIADQIILLSEGQVTAQGTVEEIMSRLDLHPMTSRFDAGAVISAIYSGYDREFDLGELSFDGGTLRIAGLNAEIGIHLRAHIRARDVSLMLDKPKDTSVLNVFKGELIEIRHEDGPQLDLLINIGTPLIARITRKSLNDLNLDIGSKVYAMIKAVAIDRKTLGINVSPLSKKIKPKKD
ncbi:MAG TPA: molybdenum ABC transporter ATP-binding protein [Rhodospirillales bacterium]|nr:molybdenum ABC transporter ATP-binding protein [Rhodospirillales bacterium]HIN76388.1 molybdenum ABC transporter ATP-binding protein [Rhodospirillales bacterium]